MNVLRKIKRKLVKDKTSNPHKQRFLVRHQKIISDIDPRRQARKWVASKFSRKLISKKTIQMKLQTMLKKTELVHIDNQLNYKLYMEKKKDNEKSKTKTIY